MLPSVPTLPLSTLPFPYASSPPPYLILDLSSLLYLIYLIYVHPFIYHLQFSLFIFGQPIKTTYSGYAGPNYIVNCDFYLFYLVLCS